MRRQVAGWDAAPVDHPPMATSAGHLPVCCFSQVPPGDGGGLWPNDASTDPERGTSTRRSQSERSLTQREFESIRTYVHIGVRRGVFAVRQAAEVAAQAGRLPVDPAQLVVAPTPEVER